MKIMSNITIGLVTAAILFVGCGDGATPSAAKASGTKASSASSVVTEASLGLRKTDLYTEKDETVGHAAKYSKTVTGSGHKIKRAFQDAPPMIPHDVEGMVPITIKDNQCKGCHMPAEAKSMGMGATAIPVSHLTDFRAKTTIASDGRIAKNGVATDNTSVAGMSNVSIKEQTKLVGARFNCTQCHASQSGDDLAVENNFEADFTSADGATASSWSGTKLMEGIDTINGK